MSENCENPHYLQDSKKFEGFEASKSFRDSRNLKIAYTSSKTLEIPELPRFRIFRDSRDVKNSAYDKDSKYVELIKFPKILNISKADDSKKSENFEALKIPKISP